MDTGWEAVYAASYRRLVALLIVVSGSRAEAEEAVQEAFARALGLTGRRAVVDDPEGWLYRVAVNVVRSRWRRLRTARRAAADLVPVPPDFDADEVAERIALLAALRRLPYHQREALALYYLADLPVQAVAARLGIPTGTVKARLSKGRDALARLLTERNVKGGTRHA